MIINGDNHKSIYVIYRDPANTTHRPNAGPMLARRRPNIGPTLDRCVLFAGDRDLHQVILYVQRVYLKQYNVRSPGTWLCPMSSNQRFEKCEIKALYQNSSRLEILAVTE